MSPGYGGDDSDSGDFNNDNEYNPYTTDRLNHEEDNAIGFEINFN